MTTMTDRLDRELASHLSAKAADYFPQHPGVPDQVRLQEVQPRQFATLYWWELCWADRRAVVLVKVTHETDGAVPGNIDPHRSRVVPAADPVGAELAALRAIESAFGAHPDPRCRTVRVLDGLWNGRGMVLECVPGVSLKSLLWTAFRLRGGRPSKLLLVGCTHAGVWLRKFHGAASLLPQAVRGDTREAFLAWTSTLREFLAVDARAQSAYIAALPRMARAAERWLPDALPLGPVHGDLAPRNVLVEPSGSVTAIDTLIAWRSCIWEDVAQFLVELEANKLQAWSGGCAFAPQVLTQLESAFLRGYFAAEPVPWQALRLYQAQTLLTRWGAALWRRELATGVRRCSYGVASRLAANYYRRLLERWLICAETPPNETLNGRANSGVFAVPQPAAGGAV